MKKEDLNKMSIERLVDLWDEISKMKVTQEIADVRGWILEALEEKNPEGMDAYYEIFGEDEDLRKYVL